MSSLWPHAQFIKSAPKIEHLPDDMGQEIVFIGRSNVGKSSLLNALTQKNLARTSKTPGRTQAFNCFDVGNNQRLIDVPGMGFATSSDRTRRHWIDMLAHYLVHRSSLVGVVLISDLRHDFQKWDQTLINWCLQSGHPLHVVFNKSDKLSQSERSKGFQTQKKVLETLHPDASCQWLSVKQKQNFEALHTTLAPWFIPDTHSQ